MYYVTKISPRLPSTFRLEGQKCAMFVFIWGVAALYTVQEAEEDASARMDYVLRWFQKHATRC